MTPTISIICQAVIQVQQGISLRSETTFRESNLTRKVSLSINISCRGISHLQQEVCPKKVCQSVIISGSRNNVLRRLKGKKHRQIKLQRLQKVRIWGFGLLVR